MVAAIDLFALALRPAVTSNHVHTRKKKKKKRAVVGCEIRKRHINPGPHFMYKFGLAIAILDRCSKVFSPS
jgi:hypothetical protein